MNTKQTKNELKNFGLSINKEGDPRAYVLGSGTFELPKIVLKEDGQWDQWLPVYEAQFNDSFETFGCTVFGTLNAIEMVIKRLTNLEPNYSERFNYIIAKITPPGADPHAVMESIREHGVIKQELLPFTSTMKRAEFLQPNPMTKVYLDEGMKFGYEIQHQYLWTADKKLTRDQRMQIMKENLKYSPLPISVTAWIQDDKGLYIDAGQPNTHWCVCFGWNQKNAPWYNPALPEGWKIFDSYDQSVKIVSFDHNFEIGKRIHLELNNYLPKVSLIDRILKLMYQLLPFLKAQEAQIPAQPTPTPTPAPAPQPEPPVERGSLLNEWVEAIEDFEGAPKAWNNPGAIRGNDGKFLQFQTKEQGIAYLKDYLTRAATGKHRAYPKGGETTLLEFQAIYSPAADNNNPKQYATFIAKRLNVSLDTKIKNLI